MGQDHKLEDQTKHESGRDFNECPRTKDVMKRDEEYVGKRVMGIEVRGSRRRGRPKKRRADCVKDDLERKCMTELHGDDYRPISTHIEV